jgi:isoprenylcysteine carboxyl methyltransferase (ICMT) family protein YpbQ
MMLLLLSSKTNFINYSIYLLLLPTLVWEEFFFNFSNLFVGISLRTCNSAPLSLLALEILVSKTWLPTHLNEAWTIRIWIYCSILDLIHKRPIALISSSEFDYSRWTTLRTLFSRFLFNWIRHPLFFVCIHFQFLNFSFESQLQIIWSLWH